MHECYYKQDSGCKEVPRTDFVLIENETLLSKNVYRLLQQLVEMGHVLNVARASIQFE